MRCAECSLRLIPYSLMMRLCGRNLFSPKPSPRPASARKRDRPFPLSAVPSGVVERHTIPDAPQQTMAGGIRWAYFLTAPLDSELWSCYLAVDQGVSPKQFDLQVGAHRLLPTQASFGVASSSMAT
jgi:hypothetical protein